MTSASSASIQQTAVVTGAASGVGAATARRFGVAGYSVLACDIAPTESIVAEISAAGGTASGLDIDLTADGAPAAVIEAAVSEFKRLDILIHNAGIGSGAPVEATTEQDLDRIWALNYRSGHLLAKHAIPALREAGGGSIMFTTAVAGHGGMAMVSPYASSKAALITLSKTIALEYGREGIRSNCISPGPVNTPMLAGAAEAYGIPESAFAAMLPTGRVVEPEEVADGFVYLAGESARSINGHVLVIDGGFLAGPFAPPEG